MDKIEFIALTLDERRFALPLRAVQSVAHAVEVTPLPGAPEVVAGVVNVRGRPMPVFDLRKRFGFAEREIGLSDHMLIAEAAGRGVVLLADSVTGVVECAAEDITAAESIVPGLQHVQGVAKLRDGLILIHDLGRFLSLKEACVLDDAMNGA